MTEYSVLLQGAFAPTAGRTPFLAKTHTYIEAWGAIKKAFICPLHMSNSNIGKSPTLLKDRSSRANTMSTAKVDYT